MRYADTASVHRFHEAAGLGTPGHTPPDAPRPVAQSIFEDPQTGAVFQSTDGSTPERDQKVSAALALYAYCNGIARRQAGTLWVCMAAHGKHSDAASACAGRPGVPASVVHPLARRGGLRGGAGAGPGRQRRGSTAAHLRLQQVSVACGNLGACCTPWRAMSSTNQCHSSNPVKYRMQCHRQVSTHSVQAIVRRQRPKSVERSPQGAAAAQPDCADHAAAAAGHHLRGGRRPQARGHQRLHGRLARRAAGPGAAGCTTHVTVARSHLRLARTTLVPIIPMPTSLAASSSAPVRTPYHLTQSAAPECLSG